jgi:uncharacterized DUF497 family protein
MMRFEWDDEKNAANIAKHGIDFLISTAVFDDPNRLEEDSSKPEYDEVRIKTIGKADAFIFVLTHLHQQKSKQANSLSTASQQR